MLWAWYTNSSPVSKDRLYLTLYRNIFWQHAVAHTLPRRVMEGMVIENYHFLFRKSYFDAPVHWSHAMPPILAGLSSLRAQVPAFPTWCANEWPSGADRKVPISTCHCYSDDQSNKETRSMHLIFGASMEDYAKQFSSTSCQKSVPLLLILNVTSYS